MEAVKATAEGVITVNAKDARAFGTEAAEARLQQLNIERRNPMPHDVETLKSIIHYNFSYLGVMGSQTKIDKIKAQLLEYGIEQEKLSQLYAPIGEPINSQTPFEIAVSIAAQIIKVKNKPK